MLQYKCFETALLFLQLCKLPHLSKSNTFQVTALHNTRCKLHPSSSSPSCRSQHHFRLLKMRTDSNAHYHVMIFRVLTERIAKLIIPRPHRLRQLPPPLGLLHHPQHRRRCRLQALPAPAALLRRPRRPRQHQSRRLARQNSKPFGPSAP